MSNPPVADLNSFENQPEEWSLRQPGGAIIGPFPWPMVIRLLQEGKIPADTEFKHPVKTKGQWVGAMRIKAIAEYFAKQGVTSTQPAPSAPKASNVPQSAPAPTASPKTTKPSEDDDLRLAPLEQAASTPPEKPALPPAYIPPSPTPVVPTQVANEVAAEQSDPYAFTDYAASSKSSVIESETIVAPPSLMHLFDFTFEKYATPVLVRILWILVWIGLAISLAINTFILLGAYSMARDGGILAAVQLGFIFGIVVISHLGGLLLFRVGLECIACLFNISQSLKSIEKRRLE